MFYKQAPIHGYNKSNMDIQKNNTNWLKFLSLDIL